MPISRYLDLDEGSKRYVTISTHKGLYSYMRLPCGIASAPAIFQNLMEQVLHGLSGVICYMDDILVTGSSEEEHLRNLEAVLSQLQRRGLRLKKEKCAFMQPSVEYLGFHIPKEGIGTSKAKVDAVLEAPVPLNVSELCSFLGLVNYYSKFIPNLSSLCEPLNGLLRKEVTWNWDRCCNQAFQGLKRKLVSAQVLVHYDVSLPLKLECDASSYGPQGHDFTLHA